MNSPQKKISDRLADGIKRFQPILTASKARDDGEGDTVIIVTAMLDEIFGYDKFTELTAEFAIKGTYCDLATKIDGVVQALIEVKAVGTELKDPHVKQVVDYAANKGVDWVVLTNGIHWRVYNVVFSKPIEQELVIDVDFCALSPKSSSDIDELYLFCKEGWIKSVLDDFQLQKQALSKFFLGALVLSDTVLKIIRHELRRVSPEVKIEIEQIRDVLTAEVLKREVIDGDKAVEARRKIAKAANRLLKQKTTSKEISAASDAPKVPEAASESSPS